jgi:EAL domain-containing protein (putative c-di-GMP-specific phosphodiesterase class I)
MALCEAIIVMAHKLGLKVIAEGIETDLQRDLLTAAGCDFGQGYLFAAPLPPLEFEEMLRVQNQALA